MGSRGYFPAAVLGVLAVQDSFCGRAGDHSSAIK